MQLVKFYTRCWTINVIIVIAFEITITILLRWLLMESFSHLYTIKVHSMALDPLLPCSR